MIGRFKFNLNAGFQVESVSLCASRASATAGPARAASQLGNRDGSDSRGVGLELRLECGGGRPRAVGRRIGFSDRT